MIRIETDAPGRLRAIGSLVGPSVQVLAEALAEGTVSLDVSQVDRADERAVRLLAAARCALVSCPAWLARWIARLRAEAGGRAES